MLGEKKEDAMLRLAALYPAKIEERAETVGVGKTKRPTGQLFALAVLAGMFIGMGGMFMTLVKSDASLSFAAASLLGGLCFGLGLFLVICAGSELFTGNSLMIVALMSKKITFGEMMKNWVIVWIGNLVGSLILVFLLYFAGFFNMNGGAVGQTMMTVAAGKIDLSWGTIMFRGIMCNILVCLAVWVSFACRSIVDRFVTVIFPIMAFVACGFEHCVANMYFLPMALLVKSTGAVAYTGAANVDVIDLGGIFFNISAATVGNIIGGCVFVGLVFWYAYAIHHKIETPSKAEAAKAEATKAEAAK